ncbi:hypothetical protein OIU74_000367 [Salix koriyanagi]|uniref:Disease resistance R13L4/SHOC-2-like LRR domain-containing protein n=1 Tax=Salix koriyanagi TaxID=2511006 RepID=A0A9Q0WYZ8_9ROSI|nr:hypothetical protein OIU74_000367 [Salix koriyanagi]
MALWSSLLSKTSSVLVFGFVALNCFVGDRFGSHAQRLLPVDEVQTLQNISDKLNISNWATIDQTSCDKAEWWNYTTADNKTQSIVQCNCTFENDSVCHVTNIRVKGFNLNGVLPEELGDLPELVEIDLTRNYINGAIPPRLGQLPKLKILSLIVNRLTGPIPPEIGNITTLEELVLEDNLLGGSLPPDLGKLTSLRRLVLSSNNFTGKIPETLGNLKSLTQFSIDGSELSGKIPEFIGNWTNITTLDLQGTSMEGPIPSNISQLTSLESLRISDLSGSSSTLPNLQAMKKLSNLILRNCLITGSIPDYIADMSSLNILDLSINRLTGNISIFKNLRSVTVFLSNNLLTGEPTWALSTSKQADLSYNNFSNFRRPASGGCQQQETLNLVSSYLSNNNTDDWCFTKGLPCTQNPEHRSLFVNCGGGSVTFNHDKYDEDLTAGGPASFFFSQGEWGYSSTGIYLENNTVTPYLKKGGLSVGAIIGIVAASCVLAALFLLLLRTKGYLGGKDLENKGRTEGTGISLV